jgi:hypothetical protein
LNPPHLFLQLSLAFSAGSPDSSRPPHPALRYKIHRRRRRAREAEDGERVQSNNFVTAQ